MKKLVLITFLSFGIGFGTHALLSWKDPTLFSRTLFVLAQTTSKDVLGQSSGDQFITYIEYDGSSFHPDQVTLKKGNYLAITNKSKEVLMWLLSDYNGLSTTRGYAEGEQRRIVMTKEGTFIVKDKIHPSASVQITILP